MRLLEISDVLKDGRMPKFAEHTRLDLVSAHVVGAFHVAATFNVRIIKTVSVLG